MADDGEVMRDEEVREVEIVLERIEQVDDLRLDGHVERGHRLVRDDEVRRHGERAGDANALALASRELVRIPGRRVLGQPDPAQEAPDRRRVRPAAHALMNAQRLADDSADAVSRIQGRERVLEHHLHLPA